MEASLITSSVEGKVIQIINEYTIVINFGEGMVSEGDLLDIIDKTIDVVDPDSQEKIGVYTFIKETVKVADVYSNYCVCIAFKEETIQSGIAFAINPLMRTKKRIVPLNVNPDQNLGINISDAAISIGDSVYKKVDF